MSRHLRPATLLVLLVACGVLARPALAVTYNLQGFVKDPRGVGVASVVIDLFDPVANARATALQNITLANGQFNALFTPTNPVADFFYVDFAPPGGAGHAAIQLKDWRMVGTTILMGDIILPDAVDVTVNVFDPTGALPQTGVDLDVYDVTTGSKVYTPGATTGGGGNVTVDLPPGLYDFLLTPVRTGPYGPVALRSQRITAAGTTLTARLTNGVQVLGNVTDSFATPVDRASILIKDSATGLDVATRYLTNVGVISLFLAPGTYDVEIQPPAGVDLLPATMLAVPVPGPAWNFVLGAGTAVTGRVTDGGGIAQWQARLAFDAMATGVNLGLSRARTDTTGAFRVVVPQGAWDVTVSPPPGSSLVSKILRATIVGPAPVNLGTIVLGGGFVVTGRVMGAGLPVPDVNVSVDDARSGNSVPTTRDHSDWNGQFRFVVPAGTYDISFLPPPSTAWQAARRDAVSVTANLAMTPDITLTAGIAVTATIVGSGAGPLADASLRLIDPLTGEELTTPHRTTSSLGTVSTVAPMGTWIPHVLPPPGTDWLPAELPSVTLAAPGPVALGTVTLQRGALFDGFVKAASTGIGVHDTNVNLFDPATGAQELTARDHSDSSGHYAVAAAPGTHDLKFLPPLGGRLLPALMPGATLAAGGTTLPDVLLADGFLLRGRTVDAGTLAPVVDVNLEAVDSTSGAAILTAHDHSAFDGAFETVVPPARFDLRFIPAITSPYVVATLASVTVGADTDIGDVLMRSGFAVGGRVHDAAAVGVGNVTVSAVTTGTGTVIPLARNVSDASGVLDWMVLPAGSADLTFTPPAGSGLRAKTITVNVSSTNHSLFDVTLDSAPRVTALAPPSGPAAGGTLVTLTGTGFVAPPTVTLGGLALIGVTVTSPTTMTGTTPRHPAGPANCAITFPGDPVQVLNDAFTFVDAAPAVLLQVRRVPVAGVPGPDIELSWTGGSASWAVFRESSRDAWQVIGLPAPASPVVLPGEVGRDSLVYYQVE